MSITQTSLVEILREHVTLEVESIDRMYLNVYIPIRVQFGCPNIFNISGFFVTCPNEQVISCSSI